MDCNLSKLENELTRNSTIMVWFCRTVLDKWQDHINHSIVGMASDHCDGNELQCEQNSEREANVTSRFSFNSVLQHPTCWFIWWRLISPTHHRAILPLCWCCCDTVSLCWCCCALVPSVQRSSVLLMWHGRSGGWHAIPFHRGLSRGDLFRRLSLGLLSAWWFHWWLVGLP